MSNRVKERRLAAQEAAGRPSKRERRELGKKAAAARAAARRRRIFMKNAGTVAAAVGVVVLIVLAFTVFKSKPSEVQAFGTKPTVHAGTGDVTKLTVTTLIPGNGPTIATGDTVTLNYVGVNYKTGNEFDTSWDSPNGPFSFQVGASQVIKGWDQGLIGAKVGSRVQLDIPANLAYPDQTTGDTAGALRFVVDVISVTPPSPGASGSPTASPGGSVSPSAVAPSA